MARTQKTQSVSVTNSNGRRLTMIVTKIFQSLPGSDADEIGPMKGRLQIDGGEPLLPLVDDNGVRQQGKYVGGLTGEIYTSTDPDAP